MDYPHPFSNKPLHRTPGGNCGTLAFTWKGGAVRSGGSNGRQTYATEVAAAFMPRALYFFLGAFFLGAFFLGAAPGSGRPLRS